MQNCVICNNEWFTHIKTLKRFPCFMGVTDQPLEKDQFFDMKIHVCTNCGSPQLAERIDPSILYHANHNTTKVGKLWEEHDKKLADIIVESFDNTHGRPIKILEIGAANGNLYKLVKEIACQLSINIEWSVVDPNPNKSSFDKDTKIYDRFIDDFKSDEKYDVIVGSHVFEHFYNPSATLTKLHDCTHYGSKIVLSVPDMEAYSRHLSPGVIINQEHTFYFNIPQLLHMANSANWGWQITRRFKNHSVFVVLDKRTHSSYDIPKDLLIAKSLYLGFQNYALIREKIKNAIQTYGSLNVFGAHVPTQMLLQNMDYSPHIYVIDNSPNKIQKRLYGTQYMIYSASSWLLSHTYVISHVGVYEKEIQESILESNPKARFI